MRPSVTPGALLFCMSSMGAGSNNHKFKIAATRHQIWFLNGAFPLQVAIWRWRQ